MESSRPVIILGAARSGTKFLRDTLAASRSLAKTPYDLNFIWRTDNESYRSDDLPVDLCSEATAGKIRSGLQHAAGIRAGDQRRLLEKTVSNTLRVGFVARVFPNADFVHIIRDGRDVVASSVLQWTKPADFRYLAKKLRTFPLRNYRYALWFVANRLKLRAKSDAPAIWGVRYPDIDADASELPVPVICGRQWVASVAGVQQAREEDPTLRIRSVRYEDLIRSADELVSLVRWLGLPDEQTILDRYSATIRAGSRRNWQDVVSEDQVEAVLGEIGPMLASLGYTSHRHSPD